MIEKWKIIKEFPNYKVSNLGRVKSNIKILKPYIETPNYCSVTLYKNKKSKKIRIHRLVAQYFIPNHHNKKCVNHKDWNKENNKINNLEWATHKENMEHACKNKLNAKGIQIGVSKLNINIAKKIRNLYKINNISQRQLAKQYYVCQRTITMILKNITWKEIK